MCYIPAGLPLNHTKYSRCVTLPACTFRYCLSILNYWKNSSSKIRMRVLNTCYPMFYITHATKILRTLTKRLHLYSKTNQMHNNSNLFYYGTTLYMFRTVFPSIIRSLRLYIQHHTIQVPWLLASKQPQNLLWHIPDAVCTVLDSWWWTERPSKTCRVLFQNKINLRYCVSGWFYYRNLKFVFCHMPVDKNKCVSNFVRIPESK